MCGVERVRTLQTVTSVVITSMLDAYEQVCVSIDHVVVFVKIWYFCFVDLSGRYFVCLVTWWHLT
jgi:hypothetical protein